MGRAWGKALHAPGNGGGQSWRHRDLDRQARVFGAKGEPVGSGRQVDALPGLALVVVEAVGASHVGDEPTAGASMKLGVLAGHDDVVDHDVGVTAATHDVAWPGRDLTPFNPHVHPLRHRADPSKPVPSAGRGMPPAGSL
jgi:hypothetical protein